MNDLFGSRPDYCRWCGNKEASELHHIKKRSTNPELKKDKKNLIWLCNECHLKTENDNKFLKLLQDYAQSYYKRNHG